MIHINLLPVRQIKQRLQIRNEVALFFATIALVIMLILSVAAKQIIKISSMTKENKALVAKKASYQPILDEIEELKKNKTEQETKLDVIKKLKTGSLVTVHILDELAKIFPANRLWITSLKQLGSSLELAGVALDNATIAQFMQSINESELFSNVELSQSQQIAIAGAKLKSFNLKFGTTPPQSTISIKKVEEKK
ncbi:MAG: PilN domain-containing protein [Desulfobulbaceae bacterium]|nr:PilN domain-containing protein [Desulfobulbaceae bacterium]